VATVLRTDADQWDRFCRESEWDGFNRRPKPKDQNDALWFAFRFEAGFPEAKKARNNASKKANKRTDALQQLFDAKVPATEIPRLIAAGGGIEEMRKASVPRSNRTLRTGHFITIKVPVSQVQKATCEKFPPRQVEIMVTGQKGLRWTGEMKVVSVTRKPPCNTQTTPQRAKPSY